jgi:hypothetical protein
MASNSVSRSPQLPHFPALPVELLLRAPYLIGRARDQSKEAASDRRRHISLFVRRR